MSRRRRSLIGGPRKASQRVSTGAPAEARSEAPAAAEPVDVGTEEPEAEEKASAPDAEKPRVETAGMTIVPDADDLDDLMSEAEAASLNYGSGETFDVIGVPDDTPSPGQTYSERAPDDLLHEPAPAAPQREVELPFEEAPTQQDASEWSGNHVVESEPQYVETGKFAEDTTDHGWQESLYGGPATFSPEMEEDDFPDRATHDPLGQGFIDVSDGARPPTEEAPGAVMEDLSQVYSAPMSVPEPPPVPGIVDRYTPPPVTRRGPAPPSGVDSRRPAFTPNPSPRATPSRPVSATPAPDLRRRPSAEVSKPAGPTVPLFAAFVMGAVVLVLMLALVWTLLNMRRMSNAPDEIPVQPVPTMGEPAVPEPSAFPEEPSEEPSGEVPVRDGIGGERAVPEPEEAVEPDPAPAPQPVAAPSPRPRPAPAPEPSRPVATNGTLSVESNRRVIVSINGTPYEFTPLEVAVPAGAYTISAALPSRADSEQTQQVDLEAGERMELFFRF